MKKCIYSRCKFNKCSEICHTCNFSCYNVAYSKIFCCIYPWICLREFQAECNLCIMDVFYKNFQLYHLHGILSLDCQLFPMTSLRCEEVRQHHQGQRMLEICYILNSSFYCIANIVISRTALSASQHALQQEAVFCHRSHGFFSG